MDNLEPAEALSHVLEGDARHQSAVPFTVTLTGGSLPPSTSMRALPFSMTRFPKAVPADQNRVWSPLVAGLNASVPSTKSALRPDHALTSCQADIERA